MTGPTSKRRYCGFGIRFFALNGHPDHVIVEEFGRHNDALGNDDAGYALVPSIGEKRTFTLTMEIDALRSFARGLTPSRHVAYNAESTMLSSTVGDNIPLSTSGTILDSVFSAPETLNSVRNFYRRFRRITNPMKDIDGVLNLIHYLNSQGHVYYVDHVNVSTYTDDDPLIILILVRQICETADQYGTDVLGLDATFDVTMYKFALFAVMGRSNGGALPFAYFVSSSKSERAVTLGLSMFKRGINSILLDLEIRLHGAEYALEKYIPYCPKSICIDKDNAEHGAICSIFPNSTIILCHYHAMVLWIDEARANRHNLQPDEVVALMNSLRELASTSSVDTFSAILKRVHSQSSTFYDYLSKNFLNNRWVDTFSEVNRVHLPPSVLRTCRSNMLVEVSFKTLKYIIFSGIQNRRLDELLYAISFRLYPYFIVRHNGVSSFRPRFITGLKEAWHGTLLFRYGHVHQLCALRYAVLSGDGTNTYIVTTAEETAVHGSRDGRLTALEPRVHVEHTCSCKAFAYHKNACKHIVAVRIALGLMKETVEATHDRAVFSDPPVSISSLLVIMYNKYYVSMISGINRF
tara:strand:+ start:630 stop:2363 length:1734 start_codon:yes stop_codon:yes gene_type:complete